MKTEELNKLANRLDRKVIEWANTLIETCDTQSAQAGAFTAILAAAVRDIARRNEG